MYEFNNFSEQNNKQDSTELVKDFAREKYSRIALMMAGLSIILSQTIFVSLVMAGVAFMLATLSVKGGTGPKGRTMIAMILAAVAIGISVFIIITTITQVLIPALTDPAFREELRGIYAQYGLDFDEVMTPLLNLFGGGN